MPFTNHAGARIYWEETGTGAPLLLIMGLGYPHEMWHRTTPVVSKHFRTILFDNRGVGKSDVPPGPYPVATMAADAAAVLDAAGIERAHVFGLSMGGMIAQEFALRHPRKVASLVLVGATPKFVQTADWPHAMTADVFASFAHNFTHDYRATLLRFLSLHVGVKESARVLLKQLRAEMFAHGEPQPEALAAGLAMLEQTDLRAHLAEIQVPVLVAHGSHDRLAPAAAGEYLSTHLPNAGLLRIEGAGHAPFLSHAAMLAEAVRASVAGVLPAATSARPGAAEGV